MIMAAADQHKFNNPVAAPAWCGMAGTATGQALVMTQSIDMVAISMNQLCGCTTPLTLAEMARGPVSWATQMNGASSTILACNCANKASRCLASNVVRALAMMASTSGLL